MIIRPALTYGLAIWNSPQSSLQVNEDMRLSKSLAAMLNIIQNKCLRVMTKAYKTISIAVLGSEIFIPPLDLYLNAKLAQFRLCHKESGMEKLVKNACANIRNKLRIRHLQCDQRPPSQQTKLTKKELRTR